MTTLRILLTLHHEMDPNLGAPGATLALGAALGKLGCEVEYFGFERAFPGSPANWGVRHSIAFPHRLSGFLRRAASGFDVVDASTGDAWAWATVRRPGSARGTVLVTRSHGLEHMVDRQLRADARSTGRRLSWKYPLYHGGWRLREVRASLRLADGCIMLNDDDRNYAIERLGVPERRIAVTPMGVADYFFDNAAFRAPVVSSCGAGVDKPLRLAYLGSWIPRKGARVLVEAVQQLAQAGLLFELTAFGTGTASADSVLADFSADVRQMVRVVPRFSHRDLPALLEGIHVLVFPSLAEGFSRAMVEAMACGLTPVATAVGGAAMVIEDGVNGLLIPPGHAGALAAGVLRLASLGQPERDAMRSRARATAPQYTWDVIARQTMDVYESLLAGKGGVA